MSAEENQVGEGMEGVCDAMMESIVFYRSFYDAIADLDDASRLETLEAIIRYGLYDEEPNLTGVGRSVFTVARPLIDANKQRAINGKKGGRPKKPMVTENVNHRLSELKTIGFENAKPNKNKNKNKNTNNHHHVDESLKEFLDDEFDENLETYEEYLQRVNRKRG